MIFGDNPLGWRILSVFFGSLSGMLIAYLVFRLTGGRVGVAIFIAALLCLDPLLFIHFRMALLDPPLTAFLLLSTLFTYSFYASPKLRIGYVYLTGICLGLALATKMLAIAFFAPLWGLTIYRIWRDKIGWAQILHATAVFILLPPVLFAGTYQILGYTLGETVELVRYIFGWHQVANAASPLTSRWFEWLYIQNPIFYFWKKLDDGTWHTVIATGNFVLWIGAEIGAVYALIRYWRRPEIWMIALLIGFQFALYTQKRSTFIHYMTEILPFLYILLGVAIGDLFDRYGKKYYRVLQVDLGLFAVGAFIVFFNYWPYIWGMPISEARFNKLRGNPFDTGISRSQTATPPPAPDL